MTWEQITQISWFTPTNIISILWFIITLIAIIVSSSLSYQANKKLSNFTIYNKKRHEIYPKLYQLLFDTVNDLNIVDQKVVDFMPSKQFSKEEVSQRIDDIQVPSKKKEELLDFHYFNKFDKFDYEFFSLKKKKCVKVYQQSLYELRLYFYQNQCYISDDIIINLNDIIEKLNKVDQIYCELFLSDYKIDWSERKTINEDLKMIIEDLNNGKLQIRYLIQKEISQF